MNNAELIAILEAQQKAMNARAATIQKAIETLTPKRLSVADLAALNALGLTIPADAPPESESLAPLKSQLETIQNYYLPHIEKTLATLSPDKEDAKITIRDVMAWGMVGDERFADVPQELDA